MLFLDGASKAIFCIFTYEDVYSPKKMGYVAVPVENGGDLVANIAFQNRAIKIRAERCLSSISNSFKTVLQHDIVVKIILWTDDDNAIISERHAISPESMVQKQMYQTEVINGEKRVICTNELYGYSDLDSYHQLPVSRVSLNDSERKPVGNSELSAESPTWMVEGNDKISSKKERNLVAPVV
ncbi:hypothetical protein POM88_039854 [Heracleum sosnowskyi]|uniref:STICHEL DnaA-N-like alpha-beta domain-containing protein n=1 Tax=Heracleum sosnowskyi TaxID=360622 RepID=A0AAD8M9Q7_9APIA|nr:hypothetical protein POM88_039854 [Heracleum sosnowskyi]